MPKTISTPRVFLDANIVIAAGKPPGGPEIARVADLADAGIVEVLTTDLTVTEVAKKHAANDFAVIREVIQPHFRRVVKEALGAEIPPRKRSELRAEISERYRQSTEAMFTALGARTLAIDDVKPSTVFSAYAAGQGFFDGEGKKDQFPDAFAFECLKQEASAKHPVIVVSEDGDFTGPVKNAEHISLVKSLPQLFAALGFEMDAPAIDDFLDEQNDRLTEMIGSELSDWGLQSDDVMDAEIDEIAVSSAVVTKTTAFKPVEPGDPILVVGRVEVEAQISFTHPNWNEAMYDSEDKVLIPFEDVSGETEISIAIEIALQIAVDEEGEPEEIEELRFRNGDFQYVTLHPPDEYK